MPGIIDADTHIGESESMWKFFDKSMYHRRPVMVSASVGRCGLKDAKPGFSRARE